MIEEVLELVGGTLGQLRHLNGLGTHVVDVIEVKAGGDVVHTVGNVVELANQQIDVFAVERGNERVLQERESLAHNGIAANLEILNFRNT